MNPRRELLNRQPSPDVSVPKQRDSDQRHHETQTMEALTKSLNAKKTSERESFSIEERRRNLSLLSPMHLNSLSRLNAFQGLRGSVSMTLSRRQISLV